MNQNDPPLGSDADRLAMSAADAAKALDISLRMLWGLTDSGEIPHVRIGRRVLYRPESLAEWLASREQRGTGPPRSG